MDWIYFWNASIVFLISKYDVIEMFQMAIGRIGAT